MLNERYNRLNMVSDLIWQEPRIEQHVTLLIKSYERICQRSFPIACGSEGLSHTLYHHSDYVLVSHGIETDPVFNYANLAAQALWKIDWFTFTQLPSRLSAKADKVQKRADLLKAAREQGYIDNYEGIRVDAEGQEFSIKNVMLWNVVDEKGLRHGQAALFNAWEYL